MLPYLDADQLRNALPYAELVDALRVAFCEEIHAPTRHVHTLGDQPPSTLLLMPAWQTGAHLGVKLVTVAPDNPARSLPTVHSIFILFDAATGAPLAMLDGEELTLRRTAAASALASWYLSRPDSEALMIVGTGRLAPYMAAAHCTVRPIRRIAVWGRSKDKAEHLRQHLQQQHWCADITVEATDDLTGISRADIVSCATTSTAPIVPRDLVKPGTHVDLVGGFKPNMREADDRLMASATVFVDTFAGALAEAGDLIQPLAAGMLKREAVVAELRDLARGTHAGRASSAEITVFKSVGTAIEDLCAANLAWQRCHAGSSNAL